MTKDVNLSAQFPPGFESESKNLAIDFDGVIHDNYLGFHDGSCYGPVISGSFEALTFLSQYFRLIIFTAKAKPSRPNINGKDGETLVWEWLHKNKLDTFISEVTAEKPRAIAYIDDRAIRFKSWSEFFSENLYQDVGLSIYNKPIN